MKRRTRTILIVVGIVVVLAVVVLLNLRQSEPGETVTTEAVEYGSILSQVSATGKLRARFQVNLQAQVMGIISRLHVEEGDRVRRGQLLLELDSKSYEAQMVLARSRYTQAGLSHARIDSLYRRNQGLVSDEQYEASKSAFEIAEAQYEDAHDRFEKTSIRAPIAGTVVQVNVKQGETVIIGTMNNPGTIIMVIADMSTMQAIVDVDETDVVSLRVGQAAKVEVDALPDTAFTGAVSRIGYMPTTDLLSSQIDGTDFEVEITIDSTVPALRPGMGVSADITTASLDSVLVIPIQAVGRREVDGEERETVFVIEDGRAKLKPVRTGESSDTELELLDGLEPGEEVITGPYKLLAKLKDGRRVKAEKKKPADEPAAGPKDD